MEAVRCGETQVVASRRDTDGVWSNAGGVQNTHAGSGGGASSHRLGSEEGRCAGSGVMQVGSGVAQGVRLQRRDEQEVEVGHLGEDVARDELGKEVVEWHRHHPEHPVDREEDVLCRFLRRRRRRAVSGESDGCRISIVSAPLR